MCAHTHTHTHTQAHTLDVEAEKSHNLSSANWRIRKAWWFHFVWGQRPEKGYELGMGNIWEVPESLSPRTRSSDVQRQEKDECSSSRRDRENLPSLHLLFYLILNRLDNSHPPWWEWIFFTHSIDSNTNLFWKHSLTGMPRTKTLPVLWASLSLSKLTYTLKHCRL